MYCYQSKALNLKKTTGLAPRLSHNALRFYLETVWAGLLLCACVAWGHSVALRLDRSDDKIYKRAQMVLHIQTIPFLSISTTSQSIYSLYDFPHQQTRQIRETYTSKALNNHEGYSVSQGSSATLSHCLFHYSHVVYGSFWSVSQRAVAS